MKKFKTLIVDDHPIIIDGYKNALENMDHGEFVTDISTADSCFKAFNELKKSVESDPYDVIFLDLNLPPFDGANLESGEDLGKLAKDLIPDVKIIILTMCTNNFKVHSILKNLSPDGFLIKSDITSDELITAFLTVINNAPFYSKSVAKFIRIHFTNDLNLDDVDRKILHLLSKGVRTKSLPSYIPLSLAAIEKRKRNLKNLFGVERTNGSLIESALKRGYI